MGHLYQILSEVFLFFFILVVFCYGICFSLFRNGLYRDRRYEFSYLFLLVCAFCILLELNTPIYVECYMYHKSMDGMVLSIVLVTIGLVIYKIINNCTRLREVYSFEYTFIFTVVLFSGIAVLHTYFLLLVYLFFEIQNISLYILTAFNKSNGNSNESGLKYFILSSFSSTIFLFGISLMYCSVGSLHMAEIKSMLFIVDAHTWGVYAKLGMLLITLGLLFKLYCAPFHFWVPDVYNGSPTSTTLILASMAYMPAFYVFIQVSFAIGVSRSWTLQNVVYCFVVLCLLVGGVGGLYQTQIKRIVAYSSVSTLGYILYGAVEVEDVQISDVLYFVMNYSFSLLGIFIIILMLDRRVSNCCILECTALDHVSGLFVSNKYISLLFGVFFFSLAGIPPYTGFFPKYFVFENTFSIGGWGILIAMLVNSICACYFYINIVKSIYYAGQPSAVEKLIFSTAEYNMWYMLWVIVMIQIWGVVFLLIPPELINVVTCSSRCPLNVSDPFVVLFI